MYHSILKFALLIGLLAAPFARGAEEEVVSQLFTDYWKAYSAQDFDRAATYILPEDLAEAKKELLPVFLAAAQSKNDEIRSMAAAFFGDIQERERPQMSPGQVFVALNRFVAMASGELFEALKHATVSVDRVEIGGERATLYYKILVEDVSESDTEALVKRGDRWWLRVKEDPKETAKKFRALIDQ